MKICDTVIKSNSSMCSDGLPISLKGVCRNIFLKAAGPVSTALTTNWGSDHELERKCADDKTQNADFWHYTDTMRFVSSLQKIKTHSTLQTGWLSFPVYFLYFYFGLQQWRKEATQEETPLEKKKKNTNIFLKIKMCSSLRTQTSNIHRRCSGLT